jgi:hypothetical protein
MAVAGSKGRRLEVEWRDDDEEVEDRRGRDEPAEMSARGWGVGILSAEWATASSNSPQDGQVGLMTPGREPKLLPQGTHFHVRRTMGVSLNCSVARAIRRGTHPCCQPPRQNLA